MVIKVEQFARATPIALTTCACVEVKQKGENVIRTRFAYQESANVVQCIVVTSKLVPAANATAAVPLAQFVREKRTVKMVCASAVPDQSQERAYQAKLARTGNAFAMMLLAKKARPALATDVCAVEKMADVVRDRNIVTMANVTVAKETTRRFVEKEKFAMTPAAWPEVVLFSDLDCSRN